jgi:hypothetical protein
MWYRASHARRLWQTEHTAGGIQEGENEKGSRGGNHLKGWMLVVPNVRGVLVPNIFGSMGCECGTLRRCPSAEKAVLFPSAARRFAQPVVNRWWRYPEIPEAVVHERDLSIKCVQSAVSEAKTTRAARSRECTAPRRGRGAHARDSSIARCTRPSAVRHSTQ